MKNILRLAAVLSALSPALLAQGPAPADSSPTGPGPGGGPPGMGGPGGPGRMHHPMEDVAFVGLATAPLSPIVSDQLGLPKGEGLAVVEVVRDGPAKDLFKVHDVLVKLDDQILIDPRQFSILVRNHKAGDDITFTYLRGAKTAEAHVKLGTHKVPAMGMDGMEHSRSLRLIGGGDGPSGIHFDQMGSPALDGGGPGNQQIRIERRTMNDDGVDPEMADALHAMKWDLSNGNLMFSDEDGTMNLDFKDGKKTLVAKDAKGVVLFSGPVDTKAQTDAMSPELRARFLKLQASLHQGHLDHHGEMPGGDMHRDDGMPSGRPDASVD